MSCGYEQPPLPPLPPTPQMPAACGGACAGVVPGGGGMGCCMPLGAMGMSAPTDMTPDAMQELQQTLQSPEFNEVQAHARTRAVATARKHAPFERPSHFDTVRCLAWRSSAPTSSSKGAALTGFRSRYASWRRGRKRTSSPPSPNPRICAPRAPPHIACIHAGPLPLRLRLRFTEMATHHSRSALIPHRRCTSGARTPP